MSGWQTSRLDDCCEIVSGATPKTNVKKYWDGEIRWATPKDVSGLSGAFIDDTPRKITRAGLNSCATSVLPAGSVLLSSRAPIGHVAINSVPMATNQGFKSLAPIPDRLNAKYLFHWLQMKRSYLDSLGNGATFKEISKAVVSSVEIPLPPMEEQRRIVEVLDRADKLRAMRRQALAHLDSLGQALFLSMFGEPRSNPKSWPMTPLRNLVSEFRYGTSNKSGAQGRPALRIPNVVRGALDLSEIKLVEVSSSDFNRLRLAEGDLLFVRTNGNPDFVGRCAVFDPHIVEHAGFPTGQYIYASYLIRTRLTTEFVLPIFVREFMGSTAGRAALRERCKTSAGQYNLNIQGLGSVLIPVPPLDLQRNFVDRVAEVETLREAHQSQLSKLDELFASLQDRAFRGEL
ncbi:restriction endonuclease subunit S [Micromonospora sp. WMMD1102]|uniref:restriction endonuclease subunit S n=1 Tax=Micromonospora sp. WMMD1102 TaxID=3016105 RepID=UPI0024156B6F|nr:restriction endonuclease subunit S [Micromonospora sp. WMMD1102]MDG4791439.1 restriction endonuclease subunit S [Micromonospora sp. WMMD1102]